MEGIDESSQNDDLVPRAARTPSTAPRVGLALPLTYCPFPALDPLSRAQPVVH